MNKNTMTVVAVRAGKPAERMELGRELRDEQSFVGGHIEACYPFNDNVAIVCNDEGKLNGSAPNRALYGDNDELVDIIFGDFFVCGLGEEDFDSLTEEQVQTYLKRFGSPELFIKTKNGIQVITL